MIVYAAPSDLTSGSSPWLADQPANADQLLRAASIEVAMAANRDLYTDNPAGTPAADVLRDATCAQVQAWVTLGVDPGKAGTDFPAPIKSSTLLDGKIERDVSGQLQATKDAAEGLCDLARAILQSGGLLWTPIPLGDPQPYLCDYGLGGSPPGYGAAGAYIDGCWTPGFGVWP